MSLATGANSSWPVSKDKLITLLDELLAGYSITKESQKIPTSLIVTLNHYARKNTIAISGYTEVFGSTAITSKTFKCSDYAVPVNTHTGITYEIGRSLTFYTGDSGDSLDISYTTPGDKILASYLNVLIDAIYNIQKRLGIQSEFDIGSSNSVFSRMSWIQSLLLNHTHTGGSDTTSTTKQLTTDAFSSLAIGNSQFSNLSSEKLVQSKIVNGITAIGTGTIPTASSEVTVSSSAVTASSQIFVTATGGADVGQLQYKSKVVGTSFTIEFLTSASRTQNKTFNYVIYN